MLIYLEGGSRDGATLKVREPIGETDGLLFDSGPRERYRAAKPPQTISTPDGEATVLLFDPLEGKDR